MRIAKVISAFVGIVMIVGSLGIAAAGTFMVVATDDADGYVSAGPVRVRTDAGAVLGDDIDIFFDQPIRGGAYLGLDDIRARLAVESRNGKDLFIGIGPSDDVSRFLAGSSYSVVDVFKDNVSFDDFSGSVVAGAPGNEDFWVATDSTGRLDWALETGNWSVVLMNADGSPGIDTSVTVAGKVPFLRPVGAALIVAGLIGVGVGVLLVYFGIRADRVDPAAPSAQPPEPPAPEPATV